MQTPPASVTCESIQQAIELGSAVQQQLLARVRTVEGISAQGATAELKILKRTIPYAYAGA